MMHANIVTQAKLSHQQLTKLSSITNGLSRMMDKPRDRQELRTALDGDRHRILRALDTHGSLHSGEIRDQVGIPAGSKHYQLSVLEKWGLIEQVGTEHVGDNETGIPATVYELTTAGQTIVIDMTETQSIEVE